MKSDSTCSPLTAELLQKSLHPPSNSTTEKKAIETGSAARRRNPWTLRLRPASERWCSWAHEKRDFLRRRASAPNPRAWFLKARFLYQNAWIAMPKSDERSYSSSFNSCRLLQKSGLRISASWIGLNLVPRVSPKKGETLGTRLDQPNRGFGNRAQLDTVRYAFMPCGHLDFQSAVTAQSDEFKCSSHNSESRLLTVKT